MKILIVGAGPTGLTAALEFKRNGITPEIVDAKPEPSKLSRAVGILPRSIEILDRTGVGKKLIAEGIKANCVSIKRDNKPLLRVDFTKYPEITERLIGLPQDRTESLMSETLSEMGVEIKYNTKVTNISNNENDVTVVFENGKTDTYDWVIGADGVKSTVRNSLDIEFEGYELEEDWSIADIEIQDDYDETQFRAWLIKNEKERKERDAIIMVPIADKRVRLVSSTPDSIAALPIKLNIKEIRRSGTFKISVRQAAQYVKGHVILAGDAAHAHSPVGGRGMNLGIEDASCLVEAILNNKLSEYKKKRKAKATAVITWTEFARKAIVSKNFFVVSFMKTMAFFLRNSRWLQKKFIKRVMTL